MNLDKSERIELKGSSSYSTNSTAAFLVADKKGKTYTVRIPRKCENVELLTHTRRRFCCNCARNMICGGTCTHMRFICMNILKISEDQLKEFQNGQRLDDEYLQRAQLRCEEVVDTHAASEESVRSEDRHDEPYEEYVRVEVPAQQRTSISLPSCRHRYEFRHHRPFYAYRHELICAEKCRITRSKSRHTCTYPAYSTDLADLVRNCDRVRPKRRDRLKGCIIPTISRTPLHCALRANNLCAPPTSQLRYRYTTRS